MAPRQKVETVTLFKLWHGGTPAGEICQQLNITDSHLRRLVKQHKLPRRPNGNRGKTHEVDPTPEELEARIMETRMRWTEREADSRYCGPRRKAWAIPTYHFDISSGTFSRD